MDRTRGSRVSPRGAGRGARSSKGRYSMNDLTIYDTLAEGWWRVGSPLYLLAQMNPARFAYFDPLVRHWAGLRVLDVGCGGGLAAACLVQRGARVVGLDLSQASLHVAARQTRRPGCPAAVFTCGRAEALPFADASFEIVWCTDVLEHLADLPAAIAQMARVLKPGGLFLYDTINRSWLSRLLVIGFWEYLARVAPRGTHDWQLFLTPAELHRLLTHHGLQPGAIQGMLPIWWSPRHGWRFRLIRSPGILYLGSAVKPAAPPQGGGGKPRPAAPAQAPQGAVETKGDAASSCGPAPLASADWS
jgi:2-polyprenyl-6-hydroxyphenyl methylase / 3-demethylubiquinone-9 3-methyltransferase